MAEPLKLAVLQAPGELAGTQARLGWLGGMLAGLTGDRPDLVLLPELFACGYNMGASIPQIAESADGPTASAIAMLAQKHGVAIHYGYAERDGDILFNSAQCIGTDGKVLAHHRKLVIPPGFERELFSPGQGCQLFEIRGWKVATLICYDAEFPETVRHVAGMGASLVLVPTALGAAWTWVSRTMIPTRAYENGVYLAYANSAGNENGMAYLGQSVIAGPDGTELARAGSGPQILRADLDVDRVTAAQERLPYLRDKSQIGF